MLSMIFARRVGMMAVCGIGRPSGWRKRAVTANQSASAADGGRLEARGDDPSHGSSTDVERDAAGDHAEDGADERDRADVVPARGGRGNQDGRGSGRGVERLGGPTHEPRSIIPGAGQAAAVAFEAGRRYSPRACPGARRGAQLSSSPHARPRLRSRSRSGAAPQYLVAPSFWAEDGALFFAGAWNGGVLNGARAAADGLPEPLCELATSIAAWLASVGGHHADVPRRA